MQVYDLDIFVPEYVDDDIAEQLVTITRMVSARAAASAADNVTCK